MMASESALKNGRYRFRPWSPLGSLRVFIVFWTAISLVAVKAMFYLLGLSVWTGVDTHLAVEVLQAALVCVCVLVAVNLGFVPLIRLGDRLLLRRSSDLTPIDSQHASEVQRLVTAINGLILAQQESIDRQRRFLADASHQLRTPFAVLKTQIQGLMSEQLNSKATLPKMLSTVDRSSDLLRQLLAIEKVEQLKRTESWVPVDIEDVARDVIIEISPIVARKHLDLSLDAVKVTLQTDPWLLAELIKNLLSNAVHHSAKGSSLGVLIRELPNFQELIVWDNGGGVNAEVQARLFEPFVSASGANGVGLGLSICKQIALSMNAEVGLYNRIADNKVVGVDAVVRWPKTGATQPVVEDPNALEQYMHERTGFDVSFWKGLGRTSSAVNADE